MSKTPARKGAACALLSMLMLAGAAHAAPGNGGGKPRGQAARPVENTSLSADVGVSIHISDNERRVVRDYYAGGGNCPPGLAKKRNGCTPPGLAKKRYQIGHRVPDDVIMVELPYGVIVSLPDLPHGHGYRLVDGDLAVVDLHTHIVIDASAIF